MAKQLLPHHPDYQILEKWFTLGDELKIRIEAMGNRTLLYIEDREYDLEEIENAEFPIMSFPPTFAYKIVKDRV